MLAVIKKSYRQNRFQSLHVSNIRSCYVKSAVLCSEVVNFSGNDKRSGDVLKKENKKGCINASYQRAYDPFWSWGSYRLKWAAIILLIMLSVAFIIVVLIVRQKQLQGLL